MNESNKSNHWDSLASDLGAEPASPPPPPPSAPKPAAPPKRVEKPSSPPEAAAPPTDWNSLANLLGIASTPEEESAETSKVSEITPKAAFPPVTPSSVANESTNDDSAGDEGEDELIDAEEVESLSAETSGGDMASQEPDVETGSDKTGDEFPFAAFSQLEKAEAANLPDDLLPRLIEPTAAEKAVGDLFGIPSSSREVAPAEQRRERELEQRYRDDFDPDEEEASDKERPEGSAPETEEGEEEAPTKRRRRRRRRGRRGRGEKEGVSSEASATGEEGEDLLQEGAESASSDEEKEGEEAKPGRRRRRRRGRRGRKKEGAEGSKAGVNGASSGAEDFDEDDRFDSPNDIPLGGGDDSDDSENRAGHRNIPTWDEAIGVMIAVNMEARAKSPGGGRSGAPRGRGRGRGKR